MESDKEIDKEALKKELDQIKDAMGIHEKYPYEVKAWLVIGVMVAVASGLSQIVYLSEMPNYWYNIIWGMFLIIWFGMILTAKYTSLFSSLDDLESRRTGTKPNIGFFFGVIYFTAFVIISIFGPALENIENVEVRITSIYIAMTGAAYLIVGNSLKSYYIRKKDRYAFYIGGVWMLGLAMFAPYTPLLQDWHHAAFGASFLIHAVASYIILSESGTGTESRQENTQTKTE